MTNDEPVSVDAGAQRSVVGGQWSVVGRRLPVAALLLLAFALRTHRIGEQRVWWDEGWSVWVARFSPLEILRQTGHDVHPPLYFELLHVWRALSGDSEAALRLSAAVLGVLTVALTYTLGRRMARGTLSPAWANAVGLSAALFLTVSRFAIAWSQEIRMYALASLLAVLSVWAARRVWERDRRRDAALYVLTTAAGLYTLYLFAPVWMAVNIAWLWVWRGAADRRREFLRWVGLQLLVLMLILPWLWYAADGFLGTAAATPIGLLDFLHIYWTVLTVGIPVDVAQFNRLTLPAAAVFLAAVAALIGRATHYRPRPTRDHSAVTREPSSAISPSPPLPRPPAPPRDVVLLLAVLLLPAIIVYVVSLPKQNFYNPPFNPRYLVIFTPFYSILLAWGLAALGTRVAGRRGSRGAREQGRAGENALSFGTPLDSRRPAAGGLVTATLALFFVAVALIGLWPYYPGRVLIDDYPSLVSTLDAYRQPGDAVLLYSDTDWPIFAYHHPQTWRGVPHLWTITPEVAADFLEPIWDDADAVWLVTTPYSAGGDPQRHIPTWLADRATAVREFAYKDMALTLYTRAAERAETADQLIRSTPSHALDMELPAGVRLIGYDQAARDFKSGDIIHLFLYRQGAEAGHTEIGLIDADGQVWRPTPLDLAAAGGLVRQQVDVIVPPEAPSGRYRFYILDRDGEPAPFGALNVRQKEAAFLTIKDVVIPNQVDVSFAGGIRLLGYELDAPVAAAGQTVGLTLFWSSDGGVAQRYKVFTHLLGDVFNAGNGNFIWGQVDGEPAAGTRPTTTWRGAEVIVDAYAIPIAPDAPPGVYRLEVGLYDSLTGERLPILGEDGAPAADHFILSDVRIE